MTHCSIRSTLYDILSKINKDKLYLVLKVFKFGNSSYIKMTFWCVLVTIVDHADKISTYMDGSKVTSILKYLSLELELPEKSGNLALV